MSTEDFLYPAAICRSLAEGETGICYFGSTAGYRSHEAAAKRLGWLNDDDTLTSLGRRVGEACRSLPRGRAYFSADKYRAAAAQAVAEFGSDHDG